MKLRPTIFLSGVTPEFGAFRDAVENQVEKKGCFAENQPGFPPDCHTVEEMLTQRIGDSDAVICIVGFRFGAEPNDPPAGVPRRSYTQMEFDIARRLLKPVYIFLSASAAVRQSPAPDEQPEDAEAQRLQLAHREAVAKTNYLYYFFKDQAELCTLVAEIPLVAQADFKVDISRVQRHAPDKLLGREAELARLDGAWDDVRRLKSPKANVITVVAWGGVGKTSLVGAWLARQAAANWPGCDVAFGWSFYSQGTREQGGASAESFIAASLEFFGGEAGKEPANSPTAPWPLDQQVIGEMGDERVTADRQRRTSSRQHGSATVLVRRVRVQQFFVPARHEQCVAVAFRVEAALQRRIL